jgi:uncharacterized protein HemY
VFKTQTRLRRTIMKKTIIGVAIALFLTPVLTPALGFAEQNGTVLENGTILQAASGLTATQYAQNAEALSTEAAATYAVAYSDQELWGAAIANVEAALALEPNNTDYLSMAAMIYTKTQWWSRALANFDTLESLNALDSQTRTMASYVARKLGYLAMLRGNGQEAALYLQRSIVLESNQLTLAMLKRVNQVYGF